MIADALRLARRFHGISLTRMADTLSVSKGYLSEIEHGHKRASLDIMQGYADTCGIPASDLMLFSEAMQRGSFKNKAASKALAMMNWIDSAALPDMDGSRDGKAP